MVLSLKFGGLNIHRHGQEYLSLLIRQGKIAGYKEGRNWLTTAEAVVVYHQGRKRKRGGEEGLLK